MRGSFPLADRIPTVGDHVRLCRQRVLTHGRTSLDSGLLTATANSWCVVGSLRGLGSCVSSHSLPYVLAAFGM